MLSIRNLPTRNANQLIIAFTAEIPSPQVGPLGHPRPWLFGESCSYACVSTRSSAVHRGFVSFQSRVSSWIVIAAHRRKMYLVGAENPGHSPFRQWPFSPWSIRCSVQGQELEHTATFPSLALGPVPFPVWSVPNTVGQAAKLTPVHPLRSPGPLSPSPFCSLVRESPEKGLESRLSISAIGGNFARIQSPILVHPLVNEFPSVGCLVRSCWVRNSRFVTVLMG